MKNAPIVQKVTGFLDWFALAAVLVVAGFLMFWNLGVGSLQPWDEAWYASLGRNLLQNSNPLFLEYNQRTFIDHPPLGFQLRAISLAVLGESTFAARLPETLVSLGALVLVFLIGRKMSSSWAGLWAAIILLSSRWFLFRARSGNLDVLLLFTQLLVLWGMVQLVSQNLQQKITQRIAKKFTIFLSDHKWLLLSWFFLGVSLSAKSLISLQLSPLLLGLSWWYWHKRRPSFDQTRTVWLVAGCLLAVAIPVAPWYLYNAWLDIQSLVKVQLKIGLRAGTEKSISLPMMMSVLSYLQAAVHRWFKVMLAAAGMSMLMAFVSSRRAYVLLLMAYTALVAVPYFISEKTEIWHLVPLVGALSLLTGVVIDQVCAFISQLKKQVLVPTPKWLGSAILQKTALALRILTTVFVVVIAANSLKAYWSEFINVTSYTADYEKITHHIKRRDVRLYATTDAHFSAIVYYANLQNANVEYLSDDALLSSCAQQIKKDQPFQAVARFGDWLMNDVGDTFITAREGELVLIELSPADCSKLIEAELVEAEAKKVGSEKIIPENI